MDSNGDDYIMAVVPTPDEKYMIFWMEDAWPAASLMYSKIDAEGNDLNVFKSLVLDCKMVVPF